MQVHGSQSHWSQDTTGEDVTTSQREMGRHCVKSHKSNGCHKCDVDVGMERGNAKGWCYARTSPTVTRKWTNRIRMSHQTRGKFLLGVHVLILVIQLVTTWVTNGFT